MPQQLDLTVFLSPSVAMEIETGNFNYDEFSSSEDEGIAFDDIEEQGIPSLVYLRIEISFFIQTKSICNY